MSHTGFTDLLAGIVHPAAPHRATALLRHVLRPAWLRGGRGVQRLAGLAGPTVQCLVERAGAIRSITPNARSVLGDACERAPELGFTLADVLQPREPVGLRSFLDDPATNRAATLPCSGRSPTGGPRWFELRGAAVDAGLLLVEIRDVTLTAPLDRVAFELSTGLGAAPDSVMILDAEGIITWVNAAFERSSGYAAAEVVGRGPDLLHSGRHRADFHEAMWARLRSGQPFSGEVVSRRADGGYYHEDVVITPVPGGSGGPSHYVRVARDITERKRLELQLEERAYHDPLTGLANERLLRERSRQILALARRHGTTAALLHIDIAHLKAVNQQLGRGAGDTLLCTVAERLRQGLRESDTLARVASDEFLVLLSEVVEEESAARVVRRLRESVCRPLRRGEQSIALDARIGVALYPQDGTTFDELAEYAELALERARTSGSPYEFFSREWSIRAQERLSLEDDMGWAWDHDQFVLHYQPICSTTSGELVGAEALTRGEVVGLEALARWPHLERGMLQPAAFIPLAERTGRIIALDRWAIARSVKQAAAWARDGWRGWVSVNLSARSVHDGDLPAYVARTLESNELGAGQLALEITESTAMRDPASTARVLHALKEVGVLVAVDDFGIGHSSLAYLKHFPVDLLKLDAAFIADIGLDARDEQLLEIMISLAHRIGARVVAEGVERQEQWEWLKRAGCDYLQGYLLGKPGPPESLAP